MSKKNDLIGLLFGGSGAERSRSGAGAERSRSVQPWIPLVMKYFFQCKYRFLLAFQGSLRAYLPANKVTKPGECRELVCMLYNLGWLEPYIYTVYGRMSDEISANNTVCIPFILYIYIYIFMVRADFDLIQDVP